MADISMSIEPQLATTNKMKRLYLIAWTSWLVGAFFYFYEYFIQVAPNVMVPELMQSFQIDAEELSRFTLFYFLAYASMQIPAGILLDKFGVRRLMTIAILFCAVGTFLFATTHLFWMAQLSRAITGLGSAFALLGTAVIISHYFPQRRFATLTGLLLTVGMSGAICGEGPLAFLVSHFNWQQALYLLAFLGIIWSLLAFLVLRDGPQHMHLGYESPNPPTFQQLGQNTLSIITRPKTWITAIYGCFMFAPTITLGALWGVSFLVSAYPGIEKTQAAELISLLFIGWAIGCPLFGYLSDWLQLRKPPLYISTLGTLIASLLILYCPLPFWLCGVFLFLFGFFSSGFVVAFSICRELHEFRFSGTALGFMNMMNTLGGAFIPLFAGIILDYCAKTNNAHVSSLQNYTLTDFKIALSPIPVCILISALLLPFIPETNAKNVV